MTELRDAVLDILSQIGQCPDSFLRWLFLIRGDGLTFEKLVWLKRLMQFQADEFQHFDIVYPFLETWHAQWTYLSLI